MQPQNNNSQRNTWMTVHALTEFVFCPRAGLIAVETQSCDDHERPPANLDFSMPYTLDELERRLTRNLNRLWFLGSVLAILLAASAILVWRDNPATVLTGIASLFFVAPVGRRASAVLKLVRCRQAAVAREQVEQPVEQPTRQQVNWWDFLSAGWMSINCHQSHRDEELALSGSPWRILRRGSLSIPVFRLAHHDPAQGQRIFPQHVVRMAAYCHLIKSSEGADSPCGIVLFGDTYVGVTIPHDSEAISLMNSALNAARQCLALASDDTQEPRAADPAFCSGCHWGRPIKYIEGESEHSRHGEPIPVFGTVAADRLLYHSACGDRFNWRPPHQDAKRMGIG